MREVGMHPSGGFFQTSPAPSKTAVCYIVQHYKVLLASGGGSNPKCLMLYLILSFLPAPAAQEVAVSLLAFVSTPVS